MQKSFGTTFSWNDKLIAELTNINGIELTEGVADATTHDSPDGYKESIPNGLKEAGDVSIEGNFKPADTDGQIAMLTDFNADAIRAAVITFPCSHRYNVEL